MDQDVLASLTVFHPLAGLWGQVITEERRVKKSFFTNRDLCSDFTAMTSHMQHTPVRSGAITLGILCTGLVYQQLNTEITRICKANSASFYTANPDLDLR